jgi:hypothetical protein
MAPAAKTESSLDRFTRASTGAMEFATGVKSEKAAVDHAFAILADVAQKGSTQWSIVYDQKRGKIYFKTRKAPEIKMVDMSAFDYSCSAPVKMFDMNAEVSGNVSRRFAQYTRKANRDLIERAFSGTDFLRAVPAAEKDGFAAFPEKFTCGEKAPMVTPEPKQIATAVAAARWPEVIFPLYYVYKRLASS